MKEIRSATRVQQQQHSVLQSRLCSADAHRVRDIELTRAVCVCVCVCVCLCVCVCVYVRMELPEYCLASSNVTSLSLSL